jgi:hypothetical protein
MADEVNEQGTEASTEGAAPTDFREYAKWRATGELPDKQEETQSAAAPSAPAKTEPDSETDPQEAEDDDEADKHEDGDNQPARGKGGSRARRIDRLTRENEELKRQLAGAQAPPKPQDKPSEPAAAGEPKLENFPTLEAYQKALTKWVIAEDARDRKEAEAKAATDAAIRKEQETWQSKEKAARKAHSDYDDLIDTVTIPAGPGVLAARQAMLEDENGAEMLYFLARHPAELERIAGLTPASAVLAIGKLSATLTPTATDNGKPRITGAPKPPPPSGRPTRTVSDSVDDPAVQRDFTRWAKAREAQIKGR